MVREKERERDEEGREFRSAGLGSSQHTIPDREETLSEKQPKEKGAVIRKTKSRTRKRTARKDK